MRETGRLDAGDEGHEVGLVDIVVSVAPLVVEEEHCDCMLDKFKTLVELPTSLIHNLLFPYTVMKVSYWGKASQKRNKDL